MDRRESIGEAYSRLEAEGPTFHDAGQQNGPAVGGGNFPEPKTSADVTSKEIAS
jgi:hypothetical protein